MTVKVIEVTDRKRPELLKYLVPVGERMVQLQQEFRGSLQNSVMLTGHSQKGGVSIRDFDLGRRPFQVDLKGRRGEGRFLLTHIPSPEIARIGRRKRWRIVYTVNKMVCQVPSIVKSWRTLRTVQISEFEAFLFYGRIHDDQKSLFRIIKILSNGNSYVNNFFLLRANFQA